MVMVYVALLLEASKLFTLYGTNHLIHHLSGALSHKILVATMDIFYKKAPALIVPQPNSSCDLSKCENI